MSAFEAAPYAVFCVVFDSTVSSPLAYHCDTSGCLFHLFNLLPPAAFPGFPDSIGQGFHLRDMVKGDPFINDDGRDGRFAAADSAQGLLSLYPLPIAHIDHFPS